MARKPAPLSTWPFWALLAFLVAWWVLPLGWRTAARSLFSTFQAPLWQAYSRLQDLQAYWALRTHSKNTLIEAGRDLARMNAFKENQLQQNESLRKEILRLEELLQLPPHEGFRYEVARVMRRDLNTWWQQLVIRKGEIDGLKPGQGVIFSGGVVGRVREVRAHNATVDLISSPRFRMAANFEGDTRPFAYRGVRNLPLMRPTGEISDVPPGIAMHSQDPRRIVTSGLGGVFPEGLSLGTLTKPLERGADGLFLRGEIELDERLLNLEEVTVLVPLENP